MSRASQSSADEPGAGPWWACLALLLLFILVNASFFAVWRLAFLRSFAGSVPEPQTGRVLLCGLRLDLALLGLQAATVCVLCVLLLRVRLRLCVGLLLFWTVVNGLVAFVDFQFYGERNQHMGELLLANITDLHVLWTEIAAFFRSSTLEALLGLAGLAALIWIAWRVRRGVPARSWPLLRPLQRLPLMLFAGFLLWAPSQEPVISKREGGWSLEWASARHYARLDRYLLHQAIPNPLHEILVRHVPGMFIQAPPPRLRPQEALALCSSRLPGRELDPAYPLVRECVSRVDLGIKNVLVIQVEGLTASVFEHEVDGRPVMPFLRRLAGEGLYFPNTIQSFNNTAGGLFCAVTGLPRTCLEDRRPRIFTRHELDGYYGSLARILDQPGREHFFFCAYRQSHFNYSNFMGNQGFRALCYPDFHEMLERRGSSGEEEDVLGVRDVPFLRECARLLAECPGPFTAYAVTATTHSPWVVPDDFPRAFEDRRLVAYNYADEAVRRCVETMGRTADLLERTLLVVMADHTSMTLGESFLERLRIPLIFSNPRLARVGLRGRRERLASPVDVVPTALALLGGGQRYAGLGRNLLDPAAPAGVISGTRNAGLYLRDGHLLQWQLFPEELRLLSLEGGRLGDRDLSQEQPELFEAMKREYFAQYETARRLAGERRILRLPR